jgi:DeoR family glycerol-3-phosphate regulon repressor
MVAGGVVRSLDAGVTGEAAIDFFQNFKVDYALMSISGIELDGTLFDFDYREVRLLRVIMANARKVFLLADASKYGRNALVRVGNIADNVDALFTDSAPPAPLANILAEAGIAVHVAEES